MMLNWEQIKELRKTPRFVYEGKGTIPAKASGGAKLIPIDITSDAHFYSEVVTISYQTLNIVDVGGVPTLVDDGVNHLSVKITDGSIGREMNTDFIDLAPFAAYGRERSPGVAGDPSSELHIPGFPWPYLWESRGAINLDTRNDSDSEIKVTYQFHGYKYKVKVFGDLEKIDAQ